MKHLHQLTKEQFIDKIYNYQKHPNEFIYIGTTPSMVILSSTRNRFCIELEPALEIMAKKHKTHYDIYYVDLEREPEIADALNTQTVPVIYLCPVRKTPTVVHNTINIREIAKQADKLLAALYKKE